MGLSAKDQAELASTPRRILCQICLRWGGISLYRRRTRRRLHNTGRQSKCARHGALLTRSASVRVCTGSRGSSTLHMANYDFNPVLRRSISESIARFVPARRKATRLRRAAVAIVVAKEPETGQASVIVTLRPANLRRHSAQYALPGGRLDEGETEIEAALRETSEELGLDLNQRDILGRLDDFPTRSGFQISPFVAWCQDDVTLRPDPAEVADVFFIPFSELNNPEIPHLEPSAHGTHPVMSAFFPTLGHQMFAPTAAILYQFREIALQGTTTRVSHFDQPDFAWK